MLYLLSYALASMRVRPTASLREGQGALNKLQGNEFALTARQKHDCAPCGASARPQRRRANLERRGDHPARHFNLPGERHFLGRMRLRLTVRAACCKHADLAVYGPPRQPNARLSSP